MPLTINDLPKGGVNLRLYTFDPANTINCNNPDPRFANGCYNTGHYDISLPAGPCSQPDPQGFGSWQEMSTYAGERGEFLVLVTRNDLASLCSARVPVNIPAPPSFVGGPVLRVPPYQITYGGTTPATISPGTGAAGGYIPSPGTPISDGGVPTGVSVGATPTALTDIYRFIFHDPIGVWSTGANRAGCSRSNTLNCDAKAFQTLQEAIDYAHQNGEIPYQVFSNHEAWDIMAGLVPINPTHILDHGGLSIGTIGIIALGLWFLSGR